MFVVIKQKSAYEVRISDWSSDVCSSDLDVIDDLPDAVQATDPANRAAVVEEANQELAAMLDDLAERTPVGEDGELVIAWIAADGRASCRGRGHEVVSISGVDGTCKKKEDNQNAKSKD